MAAIRRIRQAAASTAATAARLARQKLARDRALKHMRTRPGEYQFSATATGEYRVGVYFADTLENMYHIRQWYGPLEKLAEHVPVALFLREPTTAVQIRRETRLPIVYGRATADWEIFFSQQTDVDAVLYPNQNMKNFQTLTFGGPAHVFISHGESEKAYMWSNQNKAYDYTFSAGQAARKRLAANLIGYDAAARTYLIGRPQIDVAYTAPVTVNPAYPTVLYAPTWEGDRPSWAYGSVASHGLDLVRSLVASGRYNVIARPHPRSGISQPEYAAAVAELRGLLEGGTAAEAPLAGSAPAPSDGAAAPGAGTSTPTYYFDESPHWGWQWAAADLCVSDISAAAYDWMATGKPMLITTPVSPTAVVADAPALAHSPALKAGPDCRSFVDIADSMLNSGPPAGYDELVEYYFGDTTPGASMQRFIDATLDVISTRSRKRTQLVERPAAQPAAASIDSPSPAPEGKKAM